MTNAGIGRVAVVANQVNPPEQTKPLEKQSEKDHPVLPVTHPLDPLTPLEITATAKIVRAYSGFDTRFDAIEVLTPPKSQVRSWQPGLPWRRMAWVSCFKRGELGAYNAQVDIAREKVLQWDHVPDARPMMTAMDIVNIRKAAQGSEKLRTALTKRGVKMDTEYLQIEQWPVGHTHDFPNHQVSGCAPVACYLWERLHNLDNHYAHPIEGLHFIFDRISCEILEVVDTGEVPVPKSPVNYRPGLESPSPHSTAEFKPLTIMQPDGVSFTLENRLLKWYRWQMHIGFTYREGIAIGDIRFDNRPVLYDARIAEMAVPYGVPHEPHNRKCVFDIGEAGFGCNANELQLGCDCKGAIEYLDAWVHTPSGKARLIKNAICIHEEDCGMLWKHSDHRGPPEVRRARRLVVSSIHTVGNYEYGCFWYFMMDGAIQFEMKATGIINTTGKTHNAEKWGVEVSSGVWGFIHQHLFTAKLDMAVDGESNTVVECDTLRDPLGSTENPHGNAFYIHETTLASEKQACRSRDNQKMRFWKFMNPNAKNSMGRPTAYKLEPVHSVTPMAWPESSVGKRLACYYKDLWVTAYDQHQRFPCGEFMNQSTGEGGLVAWTAADRPLTNTDVVVWYNFGLHHAVRLEDWPVQPCVSTGFTLHPTGFFDQNPCLDVEPEKDLHSVKVKGHCC